MRLLLLVTLALGACHPGFAEAPAGLRPVAPEACQMYAELMRRHLGPDTRGVPVNVRAAADFVWPWNWNEIPGLDASIRREFEHADTGLAAEAVRCDWRALGLPGVRTTPPRDWRRARFTRPHFSVDRRWALATFWAEPLSGTICLFRQERGAWTPGVCEPVVQVIVTSAPVRAGAVSGARPA